MPTISEDWHAKKERQDAYINAFLEAKPHTIDGSYDVLRARLWALGLRGDYLDSEMRQAVARKADRTNPPGNYAQVVVIERDCKTTKRFRFNSIESADKAVELLRKQPNVLLATRQRDGRDLGV